MNFISVRMDSQHPLLHPYSKPNQLPKTFIFKKRWIHGIYHAYISSHASCTVKMVNFHVKQRSLGRRRRSEDNIRTDLREIGWEVMDWIHLAQDRHQWRTVLSTAMYVRVP
jgi:hypothetical protein